MAAIGIFIAMLFYLIPGILIILLPGWAVWRSIMPPKYAPKSAACGNCRYEIESIDADRCPECGLSYLRAGIDTRLTVIKRSGSMLAGMLGWTVLCGTVGIVLFFIIVTAATLFSFGGAAFGGPATYTGTYTLTTESAPGAGWSSPASDGLKINATMDATETMMGTGVDAGSWIVELLPADGSPAINIEIIFDDDSFFITDDANNILAEGYGFDQGDAEEALQLAGADPDSADTSYQAWQLATMLNMPSEGAVWSVGQDPAFSPFANPAPATQPDTTGLAIAAETNVTNPFATVAGGGGAGGIYGSIMMIGTVVSLGVPFLVWVGGMIYIPIRRTSLIRKAEDAAYQAETAWAQMKAASQPA